MSLDLLHDLEDSLEKNGHAELAIACKSIVGSDGNMGLAQSINEDGMKETTGTSKVVWLKHKITILLNQELFEEECHKRGLQPQGFLKKINDDVMAVEKFLD